MPEKTAELILKIDMFTRDGYDYKPYGAFEGHVMQLAPNVRYEDYPMTWVSAYESVWADFAMKALYGNLNIDHGAAYAFNYGYRPDGDFVKPRDIDRIHKGLKTVERKLARMDEAEGRAQGLGQDVVRVLRALGIKHACWKMPEGRLGSQYRDWKIVHTMEDVRYHIDSTIAEFCEQQREKQAA